MGAVVGVVDQSIMIIHDNDMMMFLACWVELFKRKKSDHVKSHSLCSRLVLFLASSQITCMSISFFNNHSLSLFFFLSKVITGLS